MSWADKFRSQANQPMPPSFSWPYHAIHRIIPGVVAVLDADDDHQHQLAEPLATAIEHCLRHEEGFRFSPAVRQALGKHSAVAMVYLEGEDNEGTHRWGFYHMLPLHLPDILASARRPSFTCTLIAEGEGEADDATWQKMHDDWLFNWHKPNLIFY
jgi:hypothetical protein